MDSKAWVFSTMGLQAYDFFILDSKAWIFYYGFTSKDFFTLDSKAMVLLFRANAVERYRPIWDYKGFLN